MLVAGEANAELANAVVAADQRRCDGGTLSHRACAAGISEMVCGLPVLSQLRLWRRGADGARGTVTKSLSMSRSVSNGVGASDFIHVDDLEVRSHPRRTTTFP